MEMAGSMANLSHFAPILTIITMATSRKPKITSLMLDEVAASPPS